jgi:host factor-I protein
MAQTNIQDTFLNTVRKEKQEVTIFLINGFQVKGNITGFDNFIVIVMSGSKQQMIYKHAISTLIPSKSISLVQE